MQSSECKFYVVTTVEPCWNNNLESRLITWLGERHASFSELKVTDLSEKYHESEIIKYFEEYVLTKIKFGAPDNIYIHLSSTLLFTKLRVMVKEGKMQPFTVLVVERNRVQELHVDTNGRIDKWPCGVFDTMNSLLEKLL